CDWVIPKTHFLESWGDQTALSGVVGLMQPLINPMYDSTSSLEILSKLLGESKKELTIVRDTWRNRKTFINWKEWLHNGIISGYTLKVAPKTTYTRFQNILAKQVKAKSRFDTQIELNFVPDNSVYDGRFINNAWLQELPDPITKLTWDNAALISPKTAKEMGVKTKDLVSIHVKEHTQNFPVFVLPGHAEGCISLSMGYGQKTVGRIGEESGFDAFVLQSIDDNPVKSDRTVPLGKDYPLATTQDHFSLEDRPIYRQTDLESYKKNPNFATEMVKVPHPRSSWEERPYDTGYQWGLSIDLNKCTGCNACIMGCQSENNIPIVGKKEVLNGREMHWIRLDRYFSGDDFNPLLVHQPMTCLQCENAPCEQVCPVAATTHSKEGLNDMTYNRCIGTRYCANNCPAKVRRFNFFDYHQTNPQSIKKDRKHFFDLIREPDKTLQKQFNPNVTVRMRGIMEKCTYCVQRINEAKSDAKNETRLVRDGEIQTACQQACPADAIVFGNILDKKSKIYKLRSKQRTFSILEDLQLKPRTTYMASIRNPHPSFVTSNTVEHHYEH
ncbi:MAG: 4Fe-4S dicluster domain-containing protein, partial [Candidatus Margulisbacteria bacterium]|nr:4Fe-4S dicluster domain-containing protein [Candidatus Margulisiibacteriota bacterium]